ncbi:cytochrome O ubiquinol oxidase subunit II [Candidatus Carsonella ruddii HT isolate Thao2000]|uniref:Cytochrome O ubiquinol oxidase subunit II n=1 Tax=Candidatus Carsonella ruddii HT isolate Thao2000 TaxID=1202539 RepID=J3TEL4_CARRU|nr:cytochrome O ubiquinol oxidase subunit II [Candidatus Carsonella ruddii]AFP84217.1 cytochrome O ubiquinol oxidase subunit II [Candidatus Carsonella ruddii HT isolate Thao2000]
MFFKKYIHIKDKIHFLSLNRILENKLLLNTIYLILIINVFIFIIFNYIYKNKKRIVFLSDSILIENIIWIIPTLIILFLSMYTIKSCYFLNPFKNNYLNIKPLIIEIISFNWKWCFIFPKQKILTFNEVCLPIYIPIKFYLISNNIMNSLCIPKIGYQIYCMNNCIKYYYFIILKHGVSHGINSNYNGIENNYMRINFFFVLKKTFFNWINIIKNSSKINIFYFNKIIKKGFFFFSKFFSISKNKIFFSIIKKK